MKTHPEEFWWSLGRFPGVLVGLLVVINVIPGVFEGVLVVIGRVQGVLVGASLITESLCEFWSLRRFQGFLYLQYFGVIDEVLKVFFGGVIEGVSRVPVEVLGTIRSFQEFLQEFTWLLKTFREPFVEVFSQ